MKSTDFLMLVAIVAVALATVNLIITVNKIGDFKVLSGFATDTGSANLTIQSNAQLNFTVDNLNWNTGYVPPGSGSCELNTLGDMNCSSFTTLTSGLVLENIGNVDVDLNFTASKDASTFIGPGATVEWNVTQSAGNTSCTGGILGGGFWTGITTSNTQICNNFTYNGNVGDSLDVDLRIVIPELGITTGAKGLTITATGDVIA